MSSDQMKSTESDSVRCFQCTDENSNPRLLQCFHSFCLRCIQSLDHTSNSTPGLIISCPVCSEQTVVSETLEELPQSDIFGQRILDINKILRRVTSQEPCAGCLGNDEYPVYSRSVGVDSYCLDCEEFFCDACAGNHMNFRFADSHRLITGNVSEVRKPRDLVGGTSRFCRVHVEETEVLYCRRCDECMCEICYSENHERCGEVEVVDDLKPKMEESLKRMIEGLRRRIDLGTEFLRRLERDERQLIRRVNEAEGQLDVRSSMANDLVSRLAEDLHHQLGNQARQRSEICESVTRAGSRQVEDLEILRTTMTRCLEKASLAHLVSINSGGRLRKVEEKAKDFSESWKTMLLTFEESMELEDLFGNDSSIGEVLGRLEETDSDDVYLYDDDDDDDDDDEGEGQNREPEFSLEDGVSNDQRNEQGDEADEECGRTMNSPHQPNDHLRVIGKDEVGVDTVNTSCIHPDGMIQSRTEQGTTAGSSRFSTSDPPITMRQTGSEQNSIRTSFQDTSGHPITTRLNVSQPPDTSNYPITMRQTGSEQNSIRTSFPDTSGHPITTRLNVSQPSDTSNYPIIMRQTGSEQDLQRTPFPSGRIENWSTPEPAQPEVLFCYEADTYRGSERVGTGLIKMLIGKLDSTDVSEIYLEWDEELEHLTTDFRLEPLNPETYAIQMSSNGQLGRGASAVEFRNGEEAKLFENTLDDLIGQLGSLRITSRATSY